MNASRRLPNRCSLSIQLMFTLFGVTANTAFAAPEDPWEGGQWGPVLPWPHIAVSAANLPDGRILTWSGSERDTWPTSEQTYSATWDPSSGEFVEVFHEGHNMFCAHLAMLEDGRVFVNGGRNQTNSPWTSIFDFRGDEWVQIENMDSGGRWYPTTLALADGDIFTAIGTASLQRYPERWNVDTGWEIQNGIDFDAMVLNDYFSTGTHNESRWWPLLHVAPNGQIFHSGPTPKMHYIDPTGNGSFQQVGAEKTDFYHKHGTTIMYDEGKLLTAGGWVNGTTVASTNKSFTIDLNGPTPVVAATDDMAFARKFHNGVMLPDGQVLVIGGNTSGLKFNDTGSIFAAELWDPTTGSWTVGASMATPRNYHSVALLLADGRVLSAGSGYCSGNPTCGGASHQDAEVYSPPYLFNTDGSAAVRPQITSGPEQIQSGNTFAVSGTAGLDSFSLIKMGSTTHGVNTDVRLIEAPFTETSPGVYELTAHANQNVLTPGYWMLFGLDTNGVPSVAHVLQANSSGMPWIATPPQQSSQEGEATSYQVRAGDADNDPLVYSAAGLPAGLSIDAGTGEISGAASTAGFYDVTVTVTDNDEGTKDKTFSWLVFGQGLGSIRRDWWTGIAGSTVADLTSNANYPDTPTGSEAVSAFEGPVNWADNYGTRMHGYITPPTTGDYKFYLATDDGGELWLSTDGNPANKQLIASIASWAGSRDWTKFPGEQDSNLISLVGGETYYIEALQKEGAGGDNIAVGWTIPGGSTVDVIAGAYLSPDNVGIEAPAAADLYSGSVAGVGSGWVTVNLPSTYESMVVVATAEYSNTELPVVTRVRNASGSQFEVRAQNPGDTAIPSTYTIRFTVAEKGVYSGGGIQFEVGLVAAGAADNAGSWVGTSIGYQQSYSSPVVVGQLIGDADSLWSVFWASDGTAGNPPSATALSVGRHVGEDTTVARTGDTLGYIVVEEGSYTIGDYLLEAGLGASTVAGMTDSPPYVYTLAAPATNAVLSAAGMNGANGGWPVLYGVASVNGTTLSLAFDEDQIGDAERSHANEAVAYLAFDEVPDEPLTLEPIVPSPDVTGSQISFDANASGGSGLLYNWSFGDGTPESGFGANASVDHSFATPGRYVVTVTVRDPDSGEELSFQFVQLVHNPLTPSSATASSTIALHEAAGQVWSVNPDNDSVTVISNVAMGGSIIEIPVGDRPIAVQIAPNGNAWVVNRKSATISVIDTGSLAITQTINLASGSAPEGLVFDGSENLAFVMQEGTGDLLKLDATSGSLVSSVYVGKDARHLAVSGDGSQLLVTRFVTPTLPDEWTGAPIVDLAGMKFGGEVVFVDPFSMTVTSTAVLQHSDRGVSEHTGPGIPNYLGPPVISPDGLSAWIPSKQDNILAGALRGGQGMTFDQTVRAITSKVDLASATEDFPSRVDHDNASVGSYAAFGPYGAYLFTALEGNREIAVSDAYTATELLRFDVGRAPHGVAVSSDGTTLYVHNFMDRSVGVYDVSAITGSNVLSVTPVTTISTVSSETLAADVFVGKQLFYDARDPRLALDSYMSCASCHNDGGQDGRIWDFTGLGEGLRNTITLRGRAATAHGFLHWTANFDELQDFEDQIRNFSLGTGLMDNADYLVGTRNTSLGDPKAGIAVDLDALAAYVASLDEFDISPYRNGDGTLTTEGEAGRLLFGSEGCASCHVAPRYTDSTDETTLHDVGTLKASSGQRLNSTLTGIDTPSLISLWNTGPYLHDGSAQDVTEAVSAHSGISLTPQELNELGAYLEQLDQVTAAIVDNGGCSQCVDFNTTLVTSYATQDKVGDYSVAPDGTSISLLNNTWKRTLDTFEVTPNTVVEFEFESTVGGEVHGIGFDENNSLSANRIFNIYGSQSYGIGGYSYSGAGAEVIQIPVGQYFTGSAMYLVLVNDNDAGSGNDSVFRNVRVYDPTLGPQPPVIVNPGDQTHFNGAPVTLAITASDANGDSLTFEATGLPTGLSIAADGVVSGTPTVEGSFAVTVTVDDGVSGTDTASFDWTITCANCPEPPVIVNPGNQDSRINTQVVLNVSATDANGDPLSFSATGLPPGLGISISGVISGIPTTLGTFSAAVTVDDMVSGTDSASFDWSISELPSCPTCFDFTQIATESYSNQDKSMNVETIDGGSTIILRDNTWRRSTETFNIDANSVLQFTFESTVEGEVHGIGFDEDNTLSANRIFQVHGTQNYGISGFEYIGPGPQDFEIPIGQYYTGAAMHLVLANDNDAGSGNDSKFSNIRIFDPTLSPEPPVLDDPGSQSGVDGTYIELQLIATDLNNDPLVFGASGLPDGLSIGSGGLISGVPTIPGVYFSTVTVDDQVSGIDSVDVTWTIDCSNCPAAPVIEDPGAQASFTGSNVSVQIAATDANGDAIVFSADNLPTGLSISTDGLVTGVPTTAGLYSPTIYVTDNISGTDLVSVEWTIVDPPSCPECIDFSVAATVSYSTQDKAKVAIVQNGGFSIRLEDNTWRRTQQAYNITANTVLEFTFESTAEGEVHGIGFDEDNTLSSNRLFQLFGTQTYGIQGFDYASAGPQIVQIPVGQYFSGAAMYLVLVNDNDAGSGNNSTFTNVRLFEATP